MNGHGGKNLNSKARTVARFGLLAALSLVLGWLDRAVPLTWFLSGAVPGIKLGLANTVLLYAVYLMDWRGCVALMLTKVFLSGFMFGSMSAILYSLSGGVLSLAVMLLVRKNAKLGALVIGVLGTSLAGAVAHNIGQILAASAMLRTPQLMFTYLPVLVGIGAVVGCLTGVVAQRVFRALRVETNQP